MAGRNELNHLRKCAEDAIQEARFVPRNRDGHAAAAVPFEPPATLVGQLAIAEAIMYHAEVLRSMGVINGPPVINNVAQSETPDWVPTRPLWSEQLEDYI